MKAGRKTKYDKKYGELVKRLLAFGMTQEEIADYLKVTYVTLNNWRKKNPHFRANYDKGMLYFKIRHHFEDSYIFEAMELFSANGWTIKEIAKKMGYEHKRLYDLSKSNPRIKAAIETGQRMYKSLLDVLDYYDFSQIDEEIMEELKKRKHMGCITKFDPSYCERAKILIGAGASQGILAKDIGVLPATISKWRQQYPEFKAAIEEGKQVFEDLQRLRLVETALFKRATGQQIIEDILEPDPDDPKQLILKKRTKKFSPGSFDAQQFFLTNRKPDRWKAKPEIIETRSTGEVVHTVAPEVAELLGRIREADDTDSNLGEGSAE